MILSVLKVIGILLLVILAVFILILGILLFVPVKYSFRFQMEGQPEGDVLVKWSPVLLKVMAGYHENALEYRVRLLGGLILTNTEDKVSWIGRRFLGGGTREGKRSGKEQAKAVAVAEDNDIVWDLPEEQKADKTSGDAKAADGKETQAESKRKKQKNSFSAWKEKWDNLTRTVREIKVKKESLLQVYHSKRFQQVKEDLKGYIKEIIRIIKPDKLLGYLEFGLDDPAATGQVLGALALILPLYDSFFSVTPNFQEKCLLGNLEGKGKIYLISVLKLAIKVIFNKNLIKVKKKVQTILQA